MNDENPRQKGSNLGVVLAIVVVAPLLLGCLCLGSIFVVTLVGTGAQTQFEDIGKELEAEQRQLKNRMPAPVKVAPDAEELPAEQPLDQ